MLNDVAIIGGGPVGSRVAEKMAGAGYRVVVLEQKEQMGGPVCCTGIISQECVDTFGIEESTIVRKVKSARFFSPSGKLVSIQRSDSQACIVDRPAFNISMAKRAQSMGVEYMLGSTVTDLTVEIDGVAIEVTRRGEQYSDCYKARAVVLTTGSDLKIAHRMALGDLGDFITGVQAEVATDGVDEIEVYLGNQIAPGYFAWLVPTGPQRGLAGLLSRQSPGLYLREFIAFLRSNGRITTAEPEFNYGFIPLRPISRSYGERLLIAGSAAGQVKPTTGGGIYYGLLCADIAAENLGRALREGDLSARNLAAYEKAWRNKLGSEFRVGHWARRFFELLSDAQIEWLFDIAIEDGIAEKLVGDGDISFDWHSKAILRLLGQKAVSQVVRMIKSPLPFSRTG
ncbi:MAG: NAD(P)/FAD-dependent oxidoreductase [Dehalococcoidales bacterium]|nr:MAG: NAD(P)/FAD-dependent oxidoreductase [Dehalococcoidales bacterium]